MKKRFLSCFMALALCLTLLPATAQAAGAEQAHTHFLCGTDLCKWENHTNADDKTTFDKWLTSALDTDAKSQVLRVGSEDGSADGNPAQKDSSVDGWLLLAGAYYLKGEDDSPSQVTIDKPIVIRNKVTICLNGKTLQSTAENKPVFLIEGTGELTLTNCKGDGKVIHNSSRNGSGTGVQVNSGTFNLYGGTITKNTASQGGGVCVNSGTFNLYGGTITGNTAPHGGGVYVAKSATFNMYGTSSVTNNKTDNSSGSSGVGVYVNGGTFTMKDGTISGNNAPNYPDGGVGLYNAARFIMDGGTISGNEASQGGGVGVYHTATFIMNGGEITGNTATNKGGGVYVSGSGVYDSDSGNYTFTMNNSASVSGNTAKNGGGVYVSVSGKGAFTMNGSASVTGNRVIGNTGSDGNGGGVYVNSGKFTMNGSASVSDNTATNTEKNNTTYGGGVYVSNNGTFTMNGEETSVSNNTATNGGGVYVKTDGKFNMNGKASVTGNIGNGVCVSNNATFTVSDAPTVTGNRMNNDDSNVYLNGGAYITIGSFGLNSSANSIGVTKKEGVDYGVIAKNVSTDYSGIFFSDNTQYKVEYDKTEEANHKLVLTRISGQHDHSWSYQKDGDATIKATCTNTTGDCDVKGGCSVTIKASTTTQDGAEKPATVEKSGNWQSAFPETIDITYYKLDGNSYVKMENVVPTAVGKYKASITVGGKTAFVEYEITNGSTPAEKQNPHYTPPKAKPGLVYTGNPQKLINAGSVEGGLMQYRLRQTDKYSTEIPTATNAGTYTVYFMVKGDATHNDIAEQSIQVTIAKAPLSGTPTFTKVTEAGRTLKNVALTKPGNWPADGKFEWRNGSEQMSEDTPIAQGQEYSWYFSAANYYATGKIVPWADTSSSGSSSGGSGSSDSNPIIKTETKNNPDGSTTKTETRKDGSVTQTTTAKDGSVSKTETKKDGSSVTENKAADGSTGTIKTDKNGKTEMNAKVSAKAVENAKKSGEPVKAPVEVEAARNSNAAPTVKVELPQNAGKTEVEIPVSNVKPGTVAVLVHADGTEEILKASVPTENGIRLTVDGSATVKIVDNSKDFIDTRNHWAREEIDFVSARELVNGMSDTIYAPNASVTRAQMWTILARQNDADLSGGANWYEKAQLWSKDKGISDGSNPGATITRAQMVTMLWRTMGQPAATGKVSFADVPAGSYYAQAVAWAVESGITTGIGGGKFDPTATCKRAQIAAFLARSMK